MSNTITELKFDSDFPLSKKMEELSELSKKIDSQKTYTLFSHEQEAILTIPKNRNKIKKLIDKKIEKFLNKNMIGFEGNKEDTMNEVLKIYERTIQSYHKTIDKLKSKQYNESNNIILKKLKTYKPKKDEKVILFSPALDQPVECEYDINMLISFNIFSEKDKIEYATLMFDYNYLISSEYLKLVKYIEDNIKIEEYSDLVQLKKEIKNKKIIFTGKFSKILEKNKVVIDIDNHYNIYKEEIMLAMLTADKLDKTKNSFIKNYLEKINITEDMNIGNGLY